MHNLSTKRAVLFFNGNHADVSRAKHYLKRDDFIICADGAADFCLQLNIVPQVIIGDFDSLSKASQLKLRQNQSKWVRFNREKDESDSELAIDYAINHGYKNLLVFGLLGSRIDYVLSNIFALEALTTKNIQIMFVEGGQEIQVITKPHIFKGKINEGLSLIPLKGDVKGVTTKGLKFPLQNETLFFGQARGVSNVFLTSEVSVSMESGVLLAVHYRKF